MVKIMENPMNKWDDSGENPLFLGWHPFHKPPSTWNVVSSIANDFPYNSECHDSETSEDQLKTSWFHVHHSSFFVIFAHLI